MLLKLSEFSPAEEEHHVYSLLVRAQRVVGDWTAGGPGIAHRVGPSRGIAASISEAPQKLSNTQLHEALHVLQATKLTLEGADHDYGGHRVEAVRAIGAVQRQLKLALETQGKHTKPAAPGTGKSAKAGKGNEPQSVSNMQLAVAIPILHNTRLMLEKADHDYGGHRVAAVRDLSEAVKHLKVALQFEKKK